QVGVDPAVRLVHYAEVEGVITASQMAEPIKQDSLRIFQRIFDAEAHVHGATRDTVHLHEMGNLDTLIDIVGAVVGLHVLGVERVFCGPLPSGRGTIRTAHGLLPVPGPAVMQLMAGAAIRYVDVEGEMVTPTGAAILTTLAEGAAFPPMTVQATGYGAGTKDFPFANVLRLVVGEVQASGLMVERVSLLETQIDNMSPEWYELASRRLFEAGALDVYLTSIQMKKGRPGTLLGVVCRPEHAEVLSAIVLTETMTLGVRRQDMDRYCLPREMITVETRFGPVAAKVARLPDGRRRVAPEYEDCRRVAEAQGIPLWEVYRAVVGSSQ
ncbi:MAG: nickel pincer cofactor biosynthesis protein LarC, partial [Anaerolineae bacterium]|nr:nickel pincer cofactor biosynthesis protein LarC [Anaerolineae bacterium]